MSGSMNDSSAPAQTTTAAAPQEASRHPVAAFFHIFFKGIAIFSYLFLSWFTSNFVIVFIVCIISLAFDFWTVKNITGRLLVGLRWWNEVLEDGSNRWIFESNPNKHVPKSDSFLFWSTTYLSPPLWVLLGLIFSGLQLKWILVVVVAVVLSSANLIG